VVRRGHEVGCHAMFHEDIVGVEKPLHPP
jgi:hypothetical protein